MSTDDNYVKILFRFHSDVLDEETVERDELVHPTKILHYLCVIYKHEEPCEGRLSRTVLWEGWGEIPLPDPMCVLNNLCR